MEQSPDKEAFLRLVQENKRIIFKICNAYCRNKSDREDLAQEIVFHLWKSGNSFNTEQRFSTWMYRLALNVAISFYRKVKKSKPVISLTEHLLEIKDEPDDTGETESNLQLLQQFISELKELDRALMILYLEEKSYSEIAEVLGITETNVATKINRIKTKLKEQFSRTVNN
jgi:RNA polymerase sigma factor (sigma-70 family)